MKILAFLLLAIAPLHADNGEKLVEAARKQVGVTLSYDPAYTTLSYPGGDVPREKGVCTDVIIRAFRDGLSQDLQKLVHEVLVLDKQSVIVVWYLPRLVALAVGGIREPPGIPGFEVVNHSEEGRGAAVLNSERQQVF